MSAPAPRLYQVTGLAVLPVVGNPLPAMTPARQAHLLRGFDPVVVLEAASTVLGEIERRDVRTVERRLDAPTLGAWKQWAVRRSDTPVPPTPLHPIAVIAATTLALALRRGGRPPR